MHVSATGRSSAGGEIYKGDGTTNLVGHTPVQISGISGAVQIDAAWRSQCVRLSNGSIKCWGSGRNNRLGTGIENQTVPLIVPSISGVSDVSLNNYGCAVISGTVKCWGNSQHYWLGDGNDKLAGKSLLPLSVSNVSNATQIVTSSSHSCALISGGSAKCWGNNAYGQLGDGSSTTRPTAVSVSGVSGISELAAGTGFTCARLSDGTAKCWGRAQYGLLGNDNDTTNQLTPVSVSGLTGASQISSRSQSTCAVISGNAVKCWGRNDKGQLGSTDTYDRLTPIQAGE